jgi:hypothetical protein
MFGRNYLKNQNMAPLYASSVGGVKHFAAITPKKVWFFVQKSDFPGFTPPKTG